MDQARVSSLPIGRDGDPRLCHRLDAGEDIPAGDVPIVVSPAVDPLADGRHVAVAVHGGCLGADDLTGLGPDSQGDRERLELRVLERLHFIELDVRSQFVATGQCGRMGMASPSGQPGELPGHGDLVDAHDPGGSALGDARTQEIGQRIVDRGLVLTGRAGEAARPEGLSACLALVARDRLAVVLRLVAPPVDIEFGRGVLVVRTGRIRAVRRSHEHARKRGVTIQRRKLSPVLQSRDYAAAHSKVGQL